MDPGIEFAPAAAKEFYERSRSIWLRATSEQPQTWRRMVALGGESIANTEGLMRMDRVGVQNLLLISDGISDDEIDRMQGSDSTPTTCHLPGPSSRRNVGAEAGDQQYAGCTSARWRPHRDKSPRTAR